MIVISTRDFRTNSTKYLDMVKNGIDVILRSRTGNFKITPITDNDTLTSSEDLINDLRHALSEVKEAQKAKVELKSAEELLNEL